MESLAAPRRTGAPRLTWLQVVVVAAAVVVLATMVLAWVRATRVVAFGFLPYQAEDGEGLMVYLNSTIGVPASYSGLHNGDRILSIDGVPVSAADRLSETLWRDRSTGDRLDLTVQRAPAFGGATERVSISLAPPFAALDLALVYVFGAIGMLSVLAVALFVFLVRPHAPAAWPLMVYSLSFGFTYVASVWALPGGR